MGKWEQSLRLVQPFVGARKSNRLGIFLSMSALSLVLGCSPSSRPVKFYLLQPMGKPEAHQAVMQTPKPILVGLGPVEIPAYLDRPQIVTGNAGAELQLAEYHRWAEPLRDTITRILAENLALFMVDAQVLTFPWNRTINPDIQVEVKLSRFHVDATGSCGLKADWTVFKRNKPVLMKSFQTQVLVTGPATDFDAKVAAQSEALGKLGKEIAVELKTVAVMP